MRLFLLLLFSSLVSLAVDQKRRGVETLLSFEGDGFQDWVMEGDAFGVGPCTDLPPEINGVARGFSEEAFGCSAVGGVAAIGSITSPEFALTNLFSQFQNRWQSRRRRRRTPAGG